MAAIQMGLRIKVLVFLLWRFENFWTIIFETQTKHFQISSNEKQTQTFFR